jgi:hypothetical protein
MLRRSGWQHGAQHLGLLVAQRLRARADRRLHREDREHLEQVVLHDVADRAEFLVEPSAALDAEALGHRDLHALDVGAVPDRLDDRVGEAEIEQVLHRLLAEEVVDAVDRTLVEHLLQRAVDGPRARQVATEGLLDDHARASGTTRGAELRRDGGEQARRNREVVAWVARRRRARRAAQRRSRPRGSRRRPAGAWPRVAAVVRRRPVRRARPGSPASARSALRDRCRRGQRRRRFPAAARAARGWRAPGRSSCRRGRR